MCPLPGSRGLALTARSALPEQSPGAPHQGCHAGRREAQPSAQLLIPAPTNDLRPPLSPCPRAGSLASESSRELGKPAGVRSPGPGQDSSTVYLFIYFESRPRATSAPILSAGLPDPRNRPPFCTWDLSRLRLSSLRRSGAVFLTLRTGA